MAIRLRGLRGSSSSRLADSSPNAAIVEAPASAPEIRVLMPSEVARGTKRKYYVRYEDGKRIRTSKPGAEPLSKTGAAAIAREARAELAKRESQKCVDSLVPFANEVASKARIRAKVLTTRGQKISKRLGFRSASDKMGKTLQSLALQIQRRAGNMVLSPQQIGDICFTAENSVTALAREHHCSTRQVRRSLSVGAYAILLLQEAMLLRIGSELKRNPPYMCIISDMWGETRHRLQMTVGRRSLAQSMSCFVLICEFAWIWRDGTQQSCRVHVPPLPILSTGSQHMWSCTALHDQSLISVCFCRDLLSGRCIALVRIWLLRISNYGPI